MKKLYKIPGGPEIEVETDMEAWALSQPEITVCWSGDSCVGIPVLRHDLYDIPPLWEPPMEFRPPWATCAVFIHAGRAAWCEKRPKLTETDWEWTGGKSASIGYVPEEIRGRWRESLVELPEEE